MKTLFVHRDIKSIGTPVGTIVPSKVQQKLLDNGERTWSFETTDEIAEQLLPSHDLIGATCNVPLTHDEQEEATEQQKATNKELGALAQALASMAKERVEAK